MNVTINETRESGQSMVEYGFVLLLVALVAIATLATIGTDLQTFFGSVASKF